MQDIEETLGFVPGFFAGLSEETLDAEWPQFKKYTLGETVIPEKYREMIGLAIAANIKCSYCTHFHLNTARLHGATDEELEELFYLAGHTARWSSMIQAQDYDEGTFRDEFARIAEHLQEGSESAAD